MPADGWPQLLLSLQDPGFQLDSTPGQQCAAGRSCKTASRHAAALVESTEHDIASAPGCEQRSRRDGATSPLNSRDLPAALVALVRAVRIARRIRVPSSRVSPCAMLSYATWARWPQGRRESRPQPVNDVRAGPGTAERRAHITRSTGQTDMFRMPVHLSEGACTISTS